MVKCSNICFIRYEKSFETSLCPAKRCIGFLPDYIIQNAVITLRISMRHTIFHSCIRCGEILLSSYFSIKFIFCCAIQMQGGKKNNKRKFMGRNVVRSMKLTETFIDCLLFTHKHIHQAMK